MFYRNVCTLSMDYRCYIQHDRTLNILSALCDEERSWIRRYFAVLQNSVLRNKIRLVIP
jgi:hypothetical protein